MVELPVAVETPAGCIGQVKRRRAGAADTVGVQCYLLIEVNVRIFVAFLAGETCCDQALTQCLSARHTYRSAIQIRSPAPFGGKKFVARWIINHACNELALLVLAGRRSFKAKRNTEHWKSVSKICGAIQWINVPAILSGTAARARTLFTYDVMAWEDSTQTLHDQFF